MRRALSIQTRVDEISAIQDLTSVFESIASLRISQIKDKVTRSTAFFQELWQLYTQLRVDPKTRLTRRRPTVEKDRNATIIITSEGGLSGDIDQFIIESMLKDNATTKDTDILAVGGHGAVLLGQRGVPVAKRFKLPEGDTVDVSEIIEEVRKYRQTAVYYERYESLVKQSVERIELVSAVEELSHQKGATKEVISSHDYVFEPSLETVIEFMESIMMEIALSQTILESRLAQYASRFKAMSAANEKAWDMKRTLSLEYHRAKRAESDERLKEVSQSRRRQHGPRKDIST